MKRSQLLQSNWFEKNFEDSASLQLTAQLLITSFMIIWRKNLAVISTISTNISIISPPSLIWEKFVLFANTCSSLSRSQNMWIWGEKTQNTCSRAWDKVFSICSVIYAFNRKGKRPVVLFLNLVLHVFCEMCESKIMLASAGFKGKPASNIEEIC